MEKRFVLFIVLSMLLLTGHVMLREWLIPRPPPAEIDFDQQADPELDEPSSDDEGGTKAEIESTADAATSPSQPQAEQTAPAQAKNRPANKQRWSTLGSYDRSVMLVTWNSQGGAVERIELTQRTSSGKLQYRDLDNQSGYLGYLAATTVDGGGCRVNAVGPGTPADLAGLQVGDVITKVNGQTIVHPDELTLLLDDTKPTDSIEFEVRRTKDNAETKLQLTATLDVRPFLMIQPEPLEREELSPHPLSYLLSITRIGTPGTSRDQTELPELRSLRDEHWEVTFLSEPQPTIEFRFHLDLDHIPDLGGSLEVIKRFRLGTPSDIERLASNGQFDAADSEVTPYHLAFELEILNHSEQKLAVAYRLDGPNGLPLEGWWYSHKIHPAMFAGAGARDVVIRTPATKGWPKRELYGNSAIFKTATNKPNTPTTELFNDELPDRAERTLEYLGVDTQYFLAALIPDCPLGSPDRVFRSAEAMALGDLEAKRKAKIRSTNVTFHLDSDEIEIEPKESVTKRFVLYSGPKKPQVLSAYGLGDTIYYGWFKLVSVPLSHILHFFYSIVGNFGLAIIMLTVLVRSCMFPISRKAAKNAAMMQELAPELKKITEKYGKNEMDKRAKAQQELFRKNNYNPLSGCWLMFLQLPIFLGLYRCLSVDIELRQASLIPGFAWCSNLAGPDKLWYWKSDFLGGLFTEIGMLGPYFNILPLVTIGMFLVHQKLFMPPATDDQTRMQMKMMNFMMIFMGVMFFKVASGLCLYFIASSLWGIAERKLLPKQRPTSADQSGARGAGKDGPKGGGGGKKPPPRTKPPTSGGANGSRTKPGGTKKRAKRR